MNKSYRENRRGNQEWTIERYRQQWTQNTPRRQTKNKPLCLHFDRFWHWKPCYYYIYIGHYFLPIAYVIFILTQRLVPVVQCCLYLKNKS
jgi:hypothetical protein